MKSSTKAILLGAFYVCICTTSNSVAQRAEGDMPSPRYEIAYATYLGGSAWDQAREVIPYPDGSVLIGAQTSSADIPTTKAVVQPSYAGDDPNLGHGGIYGGDCYLVHLSPDGTHIIAATYFGGSKQERNVYGMELDRAGNVIITSMTRSPDLPTTKGCFQSEHGGGTGTSFVAKLSPDLQQLLWCTYVGGSGDESPRGGLALDADDNVCLFGVTASDDFPTTPGTYRTQRKGSNDAFVAKLKADGSDLVWSTLFGGSAGDWMLGGRVDSEDNIIFTGHTTSPDLPTASHAAQLRHGGEHDAYAVKLSADGSRLLYTTYLGGSANEFPEHRPWIGEDGDVLLPGVTSSQDFPTTTRAFQQKPEGKNTAYLVKLSADGRRFVFSTLFGGSAGEVSLMPIPDADGNILLVGQTDSHDLPVTPDALQKTYGGGKGDGWLAMFSPDGSRLLYCTYLGGSGDDMVRSMALGPEGEVYLVGHTSSSDFLVTTGAVQTEFGGGADAYIIKLVPAG